MHGHQRDSLEIGAILARRLRSGQSELGGDVFCRQLAPSLARAAAFEQIAGQKADVGADLFRIDARRSLAGGGRNTCPAQGLRAFPCKCPSDAMSKSTGQRNFFISPL